MPLSVQLSNVEVITAYLFGKQDSGKLLPVAKQFEEEMAGGWVGGWCRKTCLLCGGAKGLLCAGTKGLLCVRHALLAKRLEAEVAGARVAGGGSRAARGCVFE